MQARAQTATIDRPVKTKNSGNWQVITGFSLAVIVIVTVGWNMESWDLKIVFIFILKAVITLLGLPRPRCRR